MMKKDYTSPEMTLFLVGISDNMLEDEFPQSEEMQQGGDNTDGDWGKFIYLE